MALARLGGLGAANRARSICAIKALRGKLSRAATVRRACQNMGSRLMAVWCPAIVTLRLTGGEKGDPVGGTAPSLWSPCAINTYAARR